MNIDRRRPVPEVRGRVRRVHPGALLRPRPAAAQAGRAPVRRRPPQAAPRRARLPQALRRLQGRDRARGQPDRHPRQDDQGLDARARLRGPQRHAPDQEDDRGGAEDVPRPALPRHPRHGARRRRAALLPPRHGLARVRVHDGEAAGARRLAARARRPGEAAAGAAARDVRRPLRGDGREGAGVDDDRVRPAAAQAARRSRRSGSGSCRSSPTRRARSGSTRCSATSRSTRRSGSTTSRSTPSLLLSYREARDGRILEEGITEAGSMASMTAAGTVVRDLGPADDPVLHLLFDVRFPAGRRPDLELRRPARPGVPARRHRRAHDADRGRAAARRRAQPGARVDRPELPRLRPGVRVRDGRHHPGRHRAHVRAGAGGLLLLPDPLQRELPDAGDAGRRRGRHRARPLPVPGGAGGAQAPGAAPRQRHRDAGRARGPAAAGRGPRRRRRRVERHELQAAARGRAVASSGGTGCTRPRGRGCRT